MIVVKNALQFIVSLLLPFSLASGMLSFPTDCACGAESPHPHALYALAGHTHAHNSSAHQIARSHIRVGRDLPANETDASVEALSTVTNGAGQVAAINASPTALVAERYESTWLVIQTTTDVQGEVEIPPPRA